VQVQVQPLLAFGAGIVSFLSPCIIPIIPSYMTFICGTSLQEMDRAAAPRLKVIGRTASFALGLSFVFVALGLWLSYRGL
jgi:cytochrome c-type biogenesis protein